jgi:maleate isomerase
VCSSDLIITPYMKPLTAAVVSYIEDEGISVKDSISLEVSDNCSVGRLDPVNLPAHAASLDLSGCDALVLSACVQMPSLAALPVVQATLDIPVLSAAAATTYEVLTALGMDPIVPDAGALLGGTLTA